MSIATESSCNSISSLGGQSLAAIWRPSAPRAVRKAYAAGCQRTGWKAWRRHLRTRKRPVDPDGWGRHSCLPWTDKNVCPTADAANVLHQWLDDTAGGQFGLEYALSALGWCRSLPKLATVLPARTWWKLLDHLLQAVAEAGAAGTGGEFSDDAPLIDQLLAGELALTLAYLFPELVICRSLLPAACRTLSAGLADLLDGDGLLHARHFDRLRPLLACWTRCRALGARLKHGCWTGDAENQYRRLVHNALRLSRRDGSHVFSDPSADRSGVELLRAAVALAGDEGDFALAALVLSDGKKDRRRSSGDLPDAAAHSEWAAAAVLRPDWSRSAPRLVVLYSDQSCRVELACGKDILWSGPWGLDLQIDGAKAEPSSEWSELCWVSDKDVDYLELEISFGDGLCIQRHILLARKDRFLLLADAVLGSRRAAIEYRGTLPLCPGVTFRRACQPHQGVLVGRKPRAAVLPLALPPHDNEGAFSGADIPVCPVSRHLTGRQECLPHYGEKCALVAGDAGLELRQAAVAQSLLAPLFLDLDRSRTLKPHAWRQLTVAHRGAVQPADVAVGYRVAIGKRQWLIYRSLAQPADRSLLGHNLQSETLVARFDRRGEVESLIEIE